MRSGRILHKIDRFLPRESQSRGAAGEQNHPDPYQRGGRGILHRSHGMSFVVHKCGFWQMRGTSPAHRRFDMTYDFSRNFAGRISVERAALFVASYVG